MKFIHSKKIELIIFPYLDINLLLNSKIDYCFVKGIPKTVVSFVCKYTLLMLWLGSVWQKTIMIEFLGVKYMIEDHWYLKNDIYYLASNIWLKIIRT